MADKVTNYKCPACLGSVHFSATTGQIECDYCGSIYSVEEMEAMMAEANASATEAAGTVDEWEQVQQTWIGEGMVAYSCPSCRAELICEQTTGATACPYCGNPTCVPGQFSGLMKPELVIPFKFEKNAAVEKLKAHCKGKKLLPKSFTENNHLEDVKGVYVPFWLYDGVAKGGANYTAEKTQTRTVGDERITTTQHYNVARAGEVPFEKIPADASSKMPNDLMDSIEPYNYAELKEFNNAYLTGYMADTYDVKAEDNADRVDKRAKATLQEMLRETVTGYNSVETVQSNTVITQGKATYALLPVWLLSTQWNGQNFLFAMNGQTGKMVGDLPVDNGKYWQYFFKVLAIAEAIMVAITFMMGGYFALDAGFVVKFIVIPLIIAFIAAGVQRGKMRSVFAASEAREYMKREKLVLGRKQDIFVRTTERREKIQRNNN